MKKIILIVLCGIVCLIIGLFIGRSTIDSEPKKEYIKGEMVTGSVSPTQFELIKEEKPNIQYKDTGSIKYLSIPVDTSAIIADYELKRTYKLTAFDNKTQGKLELFPVIQYNKLSALDYNFTPVIERQTIYKTKVWQPFVSASYSTLNYIGIGGGVFYHNLGFEYQYNINISRINSKNYLNIGDFHSFSIKYKF